MSSTSISGLQRLLTQQTTTLCKYIDAVWDHLENDFDTAPGELDKLKARRDAVKVNLMQSYIDPLEFLEFVAIFVDAEPFSKKKALYTRLLGVCGAVYDHIAINLRLQHKILLVYNTKDHPSKCASAQKTKATLLEQQPKVNLLYSNYRTRVLMEHGAFERVQNPLLAGFPQPKPDKYKSYLVVNKKVGLGRLAKAIKADAPVAKISKLLDGGEDPNELDTTTGSRPLHHTAWNNQHEITDLLIEANADVDAQTVRGFTPLHFAYQKNFKKIIQLLLNSKADPTIKSSLGQTAPQMASIK